MSSHVKVAPSNQRRPSMAPPSLQTRTSFGHPSQAPPKPAPLPKKRKQTKTNPKYYDPRDHRNEEEDVDEPYIQRRRPVIFILVLGSCSMALGIGVTWYGDTEGLRDFLVIGPGCLIIGFVMAFIAFIVICRDVRKYRRKRAIADAEVDDIENRKLQTDYFIPNENGRGYKPSDDAIYKQQIKTLDKVNEETDMKEEETLTLARPVGPRDAGGGAVYHVTLPTVTEGTVSILKSGTSSTHQTNTKNNEPDVSEEKGQRAESPERGDVGSSSSSPGTETTHC